MAAEVFISYASQNRDRILDLVERLRGAGVSVWIDQMGIEGAAMWSQQIVAAIRDCKVLILAISKNSATSENVVKELALASEGRKRILPVFIEEAYIPETMAYQLAGIQRVEFFEGNEEAGLKAVIRALATLDVDVCSDASAAAGAEAGQAVRRHHHDQSEARREISVWLKVAAGVVAISMLSLAGMVFMDSGSTPAPGPVALGQAQTNTTEQAQPLAKPVTLDTNRVVVLPFKVIGTANETADMGYGLVSTLTSKLQPLQNLVVIAKESARKFKDSEQSPREIGQALGAVTIVTGEIQTSSNKVQVNIQLIDANTEDLGWGSTFTKPKDDFLDLQNEIATKLASELKGELDATEAQQLAQKATDIPEAETEYQKGRREWNKRSKEGFANAIKHFEHAIELDPNFANPFAGLADTYGLLPSYNLEPALEVMPKAKLNAEKAIHLNPNSAEAFASLAWYQFIFEFDRNGAEENFDKAIKLNPNYATAYHWFGLMMNTSLDLNRSKVLLRKALELEPTSLIIPSNLAQAYRLAGQFELAMETCEIAFETNPNFPPAVHYYTMCHGDYQDSIKRLKGAIQAYPSIPMSRRALFRAFMSNGEVDLAKDQVIYSLDHFHEKMTLGFAEMYAGLGRYDEAFRWLKKGVESRESSATFVLVAFKFPDDFKEDPRFVELMKSMNNPLYVDK